MMRLFSMKTRMILVLTVVLCSAFAVTSVVNYHVSRDAIHEEIVTSSLPLTRDNIYSEIHADLMRPIFISSLMANDAFLKEWASNGEKDAGPITKYLKDIREKYGFMSTFFVSSTTRNYYHYKGIHKTMSPDDAHDVWFYRFISLNREYELDVDTDQAAGNRLTIFINFRVEDDKGSLLGVTGVGLEMDTAAALLKTYQEKYGRFIYMTDAKGVIQLHSNQALIETASIRDMEGIGKLADRILTPRAEPVDIEFERRDQRVLITSRYMPELNWFLIVEQDEDSALAAIRSNLFRNLAVGGIVILIVLIIVIWTVNVYQSRLEEMAVTDELTGVANRRAFEDHFERETTRSARTKEPFSIILIDLDGFKAVNDQCGHLEGDRILKAAAELMLSRIRLSDLLARWGGDEFIVLVLGDQEQARAVGERIREGVEKTDFAETGAPPCGAREKVNVSVGVASHREGDTLDTLTNRADEALYRVKSMGGNGVGV